MGPYGVQWEVQKHKMGSNFGTLFGLLLRGLGIDLEAFRGAKSESFEEDICIKSWFESVRSADAKTLIKPPENKEF